MNDPACPAGWSPSGGVQRDMVRCSPSGKEQYTETAHGMESQREDIHAPSPPRYFGDTYCCPACGTAFSLIRAEITGCTTGEGSRVLRCPACRADNAVRVSDAELALVTGYVKLRGEARELIRQRIAKQ